MEILHLDEYEPYLFLAIGVVSMAVAAFHKNSKKELLETGEKAEGIVFEIIRRQNSSSIVVRFVTKKLEWITAEPKNDFQISYIGQYKEGNKVQVVYDPVNPTNFIVETKQPEFVARLLFLLTGLLFVGIAVYQLV